MAFWTLNPSRISSPPPPVSSASPAPAAAIDTLSSQKNPPMVSQVALEAPDTQPAVLEAEPANLPATDDSFVRHETYFFKDGNITFSVDGTLYCVHRYFFSRDSAYFSTKFSQLGARDHESLNNVVSLGDVECKDFEAFLSVIYPENFEEHKLSYEQWRSVLHLSTRWGFASLRKLALKSVKPPTPSARLLLARTYGVDHWVLPALSSLCERTTPISLKEARQMSIEDVVLVATVREEIRNDSSKTEIPLRIKATQARIAQGAGDDIGLAGLKSGTVAKKPVLVEAVTAAPVAEGDSDNSSKTAATTPEDDDERGGDERLAGASVVSLGETNKQQVEQQVQEATSENRSGDDCVQEDRSESRDRSSEKEQKKTEETPGTGVDSEADKVKTETTSSEAPRIANTLTEEPEAEEQTKGPERAAANEAPVPPAAPQTAPAAPEPQPAARAATPLYWRRLTSRYMSVGPGPQPS